MTRIKSSGLSKFIDEEAERRAICNAAYEAAKNVKWDLSQEEFTIDENFNFTHATWKGTYAVGGGSIIATVEIINMYIDECRKPYGSRDLSFIHLVSD